MARSLSSHAHDQVLEATLRLFAERGIDATSMDAIALASGVSKATIYKHWRDKEELCLEAMTYLHGGDQPRPVLDSGDVRTDLIAALRYEPPRRQAEVGMRIMPHLMAYASRNPAFAKAWQARVFDPPRIQLTQLLERAVARGQLPRSLDQNLALALLLGPLMYCHILKRMHRPAPVNLAEQVVAAFWKAHAVAASPSKPGKSIPQKRPRSR
jgi:AcrR family transcriptional regulator